MSAVPGLSQYPTNPHHWYADVRPQVLETFTSQIYGRVPDIETSLDFSVLEEGDTDDGVRRRQLALTVTGPGGSRTLLVLVYLPAAGTPAAGSHPTGGPKHTPAPRSAQKFPVFLGWNFKGNHATTTDPAVLQANDEHPAAQTGEVYYDGRTYSVPPERGASIGTWPIESATQRGYALITMHYLQTGPDLPSFFDHGFMPIFGAVTLQDRGGEDWGAISMWAWMLSRVLDALVDGMIPEVDAGQVWVHGHSRLGKTALWAAAQDERFAGVISNNSGRMGAALTRPIGEDLPTMGEVFGHWFAPNFLARVSSGQPLPVDQHQLLACIAPRPLYVASASADLHADPEGEFTAWQTAAAAWPRDYSLEARTTGGADGSVTFPEPGHARVLPGKPLGYHLREGEHAVRPFDWGHWLDFRDQLRRQSPAVR